MFIFPYLQTVAALAECHVKIDCLQHFLRHQFKISALVSRFSHFFRNSCACIDAFGAVAASWYCEEFCGDLSTSRLRFVTKSGRKVHLEIFAAKEDKDQLWHAMRLRLAHYAKT